MTHIRGSTAAGVVLGLFGLGVLGANVWTYVHTRELSVPLLVVGVLTVFGAGWVLNSPLAKGFADTVIAVVPALPLTRAGRRASDAVVVPQALAPPELAPPPDPPPDQAA